MSDDWGADLKEASIVMIDDEETTLDVIEMFLRDEGYSRLATTSDSRSAGNLIREHKPDIILLDMSMPHVDGLTILREVRADDTLCHIPVIILSATDSATKLEALATGAADFLSKPVDPSELALRLRNTLAAKAYQDRLAYYDSLTGLPNRRLFTESLTEELARSREASQGCALVHIALDRFKQVNDTLGRKAGDKVLTVWAKRLGECLGANEATSLVSARDGSHSLSRVGGDEFALFLPGLDCVDRAARLARRAIASVSGPMSIAGQELVLSAGIGIAIFPEDADDAESLLDKAGVATSHAKQTGRNGYQFYSESQNVEIAERLRLESDLRRAAARKELSLEYQPKVDLATGRITGVEVLMRWTHPELGRVPPDRFIPVAEDSGLIGELGAWALRTACQQGRAWQDAGLPATRMAVNVSSQQFRPGLVRVVRDALDASGLAPGHLVLELTESLVMEDPDEAVEMLREIEQLGVRLSIDDFGTGYSSLAYLKRFPLAELKIDRSFVTGLPLDSDGAAIVKAIIAMAHSLGLKVVAEGIETEEQRTFLTAEGCDEGQGYLFSRSVPASEWPELLKTSAEPE